MKAVLFVSYYFPPSGGSGVQRPLKFVRYLPETGWKPVVLTVDPASAAYPALDPTLSEEIPPEATVYRTRAWDPYRWYARLRGLPMEKAVTIGFGSEQEPDWKERLARWIRGNLFLPDARVGWVPFAYRQAKQLLHGHDIRAVVTTGPPHSTHLVGYLLRKYHGLPWVADFRDPWVGIDYARALPMSAPARRMDAWLERLVLETADEVLTVSPSMQTHLRRRYARTYRLIYNGFDPADFSSPAPPLPRDRFVIRHVGNLNPDRNPRALLRILKDPAFAQVHVELTGKVDASIRQEIVTQGLQDRVHVEGYVSHPEAVARMRGSHLLLLVINRAPGAEGIITGKLYEYLASGRPILALAPPGGDAARVLHETGAGVASDHEDEAGIRAFLQKHLEAWQRGTPLTGASPEALAPYSRRTQTHQLAELLNTHTHA